MNTETISSREKGKSIKRPENQCTHHWIIDPPDGPVSNGTCKKCGKTRQFMNWGYNAEIQ